MKIKILILFLMVYFNNYWAKSQQEELPNLTSLPSSILFKKKTRSHKVEPQLMDLNHVILKANIDFNNSRLTGEVWLKLKPHIFSTDSAIINATCLNISTIKYIINQNTEFISIPYSYDLNKIVVKFPQTIETKDSVIVYIKYSVQSQSCPSSANSALTMGKKKNWGLFFVNPQGLNRRKPIQLWTQGEPEATSNWLPLIDKINQKATQEFYITYPKKFTSLSNGELISRQLIDDSLQMDYWKMSLPHSPYLMFIGVGDFAVIKDEYNQKDISYFVDKNYAPFARQIFGETPKMINFFENLLGQEYVWNKLDQMVASDYISGAMENTTCVLHDRASLQTSRELIDQNSWETTIAHEIFHHWFGNLVTAENWGNLTVNESFANYAELLWLEYKYGKDFADYENYDASQRYFFDPEAYTKNLVRYDFEDPKDMFDVVSYQKGGRILNMLRNHLGDSAFFKGLHRYLISYKFGYATADKLRLVLEEVSGQNLRWFFDQWYYNSGHPVVELNYSFNENQKQLKVFIKQKQENIFQLPLKIDVYINDTPIRFIVLCQHRSDTFNFTINNQPQWVNIDADKKTLWIKKERKSVAESIFQYDHALNLIDRLEAVDNLKNNLTSNLVKNKLWQIFLKDTFYAVKIKALQSFNGFFYDTNFTNNLVKTASDLTTDFRVREQVIDVLANQDKHHSTKLINSFKLWLNDSSYTVAGAAFDALLKKEYKYILKKIPQFKNTFLSKRLKVSFIKFLLNQSHKENSSFLYQTFSELSLVELFGLLNDYAVYIGNQENLTTINQYLQLIETYKNNYNFSFWEIDFFKTAFINEIIKTKRKRKENNSVTYLQNYLKKF